jgi:hypothetical protein
VAFTLDDEHLRSGASFWATVIATKPFEMAGVNLINVDVFFYDRQREKAYQLCLTTLSTDISFVDLSPTLLMKEYYAQQSPLTAKESQEYLRRFE